MGAEKDQKAKKKKPEIKKLRSEQTMAKQRTRGEGGQMD